jgi:uncharacterized protein (TIGR03437 family)
MKTSRVLPVGIAALGAFACSGAYGQAILNQFTVPHPQALTGPYYDEAEFVTPDGSGNLFEFNHADGTLHKFDSAGKELWATAALAIPPLQGAVNGMVVTGSGVYLAGFINGALPGQTGAGSTDVFVRKYDPNGKELWTRQFGTADWDYVNGIASDSTGLYVVGVSENFVQGQPITSSTIFINRFDSAGNQMWTYRSAPSGAPPMAILGAAADSTGVYFYGNDPVHFSNYNILRKVDSAGNDLWTYRFEDLSIILGVAGDSQGAYVLFFPGAEPTYTVRRVDLNGSEVWTREIAAAYVSGFVAADADGFYVAGGTSQALRGQCYAGQGDVFLMRFDANGNPLWTREFGTAKSERPALVTVGAAQVDISGFIGIDTVFVASLQKSTPAASGSRPAIQNECVLNAAGYLGGGVAPGEIVTIIGSNLGPSDYVGMQVSSDGHIASALAGTRILFNGEAAPLVSVSSLQSSAIAPYDISGAATVKVQVEYNGTLSDAVQLPVFRSRPGIFSFGPAGSGQGAILNEDGTVNSAFHPAARGSVVSIFATGAGLPQPLGAVDQISAGLSSFQSTPSVRLETDGSCDVPYSEAQVLYYGGAPGAVPGLVQINARVPLDVTVSDQVPLYLVFPDGTIEQNVTIAIR